MKTYYKAVFPDGTTIVRSTDGRQYSHAWVVRWHYQGEQNSGDGQDQGFSGSQELASKAGRQYAANYSDRPDYTVFFHGTATAVEIDRAEYTALRAK